MPTRQNRKRSIFFSLVAAALFAVQSPARAEVPTLGKIERKDPRLDKLIPPNAVIEKLADGFDWSEGPVWVSEGKYLLFSDVPKNVVHKWQDGKVSEFLKPSGYTGTAPRGGEPGSNGLTLDAQSRLILAEHGDRRIARVEKDGSKTTLADRFEGKRFNSPNDVVLDSKGNVFFTDPPYGLEKNADDPKKEIDFQGVYRIAADGKLTLLTKEMSRPNGVALSPDEKMLYVANSDPKRAVIMGFPLSADGSTGVGKVFFDAAPLIPGRKGMPDGLKVDRDGNLFATGPGGVLIIAPDGTHLGTIATGEATANCAWGGDDGAALYITADMFLCRVQTSTRGKQPGKAE